MSDHVHRWEHSINWSHAVLGLAVIILVVEYGDTLSDAADMDARDGAEAAATAVTGG